MVPGLLCGNEEEVQMRGIEPETHQQSTLVITADETEGASSNSIQRSHTVMGSIKGCEVFLFRKAFLEGIYR